MHRFAPGVALAGTRAVTMLAFMLLATTPARAACEAFVSFSSFDPAGGDFSYVHTPGVYQEPSYPYGPPVSVTLDLLGVFWEIGLGDPAGGEGVDNGTFPALEDFGTGYFTGGWIYNYGPYPSLMYGNWSNPLVDGCIGEGAGNGCMAVLLNDRDEDDKSYFALLSAPLDTEESAIRFAQPGGAPILLAETPVPFIVATTTIAGPLEIDLASVDPPAAALYLAADTCDVPVTGYRVYQQTRFAHEDPPSDRDRGAGWVVAVGGSGPAGAPLPSGAAARVSATDCSAGGAIYLATTFVFDTVFELSNVSANSMPIDCGSCRVVDDDGDGAETGPCTPRLAFDCADTDPRIFPGAAQACDGVNNDCLHPGWPLLANTGEIDDDGDGLTGCEGDPCPLDADDDSDSDGVCGDVDVCPELFDPEQVDGDGDGRGDPCDPCPADPDDDLDGDTICGDVDNCPAVVNLDQADGDGDGVGDACDDCPLDPDNDLDGDRICGDVDPCPEDASNDLDDDGLCANVDPCPFDHDNDADTDGHCANVDNCPEDENPGQVDGDGDGFGDACDVFGRSRTVDDDVDGPSAVIAADIDADGDLDAVSASLNDGTLQWHENVAGDGGSWVRHAVVSVVLPRDLAVADLDGDGARDLVLASREVVAWYVNVARDGSLWEARTISTAYRFPHRLAISDIDGDGDHDVASIVFDDANDGHVVWHENVVGDATVWADRSVGALVNEPEALDVADVDGDGDADVLLGEAGFLGGGRRLLWIENLTGDGADWALHVIAVDREFESLAAVDVDGDGDRDALVAVGFGVGNQAGGTYWYENRDGVGGSWGEHLVATTNLDHDSLTATDMDADGDVDAVVATSSRGLLVWHENLAGDGSVWRDRPAVVLSGIRTATAAGDLDADGDVDLLGGFSRTVIWVERVAPVNQRPLARAGGDRAVDCLASTGTPLVLDGRASSDADGTITAFEWFEDFATPAERLVGVGVTVGVELAFGQHALTLRVTDDAGAQDLDAFAVAVVDSTPPELSLDLSPGILWPPDGRLVTVLADAHGTDRCSGLASLDLFDVTSDEPGDGRPADIVGAEPGTPDIAVDLRAERLDAGDGRTYTVTWRGSDLAANSAIVAATVEVPLDEHGVARLIELTVDRVAAGAAFDWTLVAEPAEYALVRGPLSPDLGPLTCLGVGPAVAFDPDPALPAEGRAFFYLVGFRTAHGDLFGAHELPANPCPD